MKKAFAILLAVLILSISLKDLAIYALFKANQEYLTENNCINRFSPEELCFATCVLTTTMQDSQEQKEQPGTLLDQNQKVVYVLDSFQKQVIVADLEQDIVPTKAVVLFPQTFLTSIFQPPEC